MAVHGSMMCVPECVHRCRPPCSHSPSICPQEIYTPLCSVERDRDQRADWRQALSIIWHTPQHLAAPPHKAHWCADNCALQLVYCSPGRCEALREKAWTATYTAFRYRAYYCARRFGPRQRLAWPLSGAIVALLRARRFNAANGQPLPEPHSNDAHARKPVLRSFPIAMPGPLQARRCRKAGHARVTGPACGCHPSNSAGSVRVCQAGRPYKPHDSAHILQAVFAGSVCRQQSSVSAGNAISLACAAATPTSTVCVPDGCWARPSRLLSLATDAPVRPRQTSGRTLLAPSRLMLSCRFHVKPCMELRQLSTEAISEPCAGASVISQMFFRLEQTRPSGRAEQGHKDEIVKQP